MANNLIFYNQHNKLKELLQSQQCHQCNFSKSNLQGVNLQRLNLQGGNLEGAKLSEAKFANANLKMLNKINPT
ncbi:MULTISPECIES: pentapeptide repeat-containing protein [unclassified Microcoleus]|uniref:pentapeptide repeat-containing protein n=1 Tax=unclassified Microcoleus TaxID=2642155 RepID=UPI002FD66B2D